MKKKLFLLFIMAFAFVFPRVVNAEEYIYKICDNNCEWNYNDFGEISSEISDYFREDLSDGLIENRYYISFGDGGHTFSDLDFDFDSILGLENVDLLFGEGTYKFNSFTTMASTAHYFISGQGPEKTIIEAENMGINAYVASIRNVTLKVGGTLNFNVLGNELSSVYGSREQLRDDIPVDYYVYNVNIISDSNHYRGATFATSCNTYDPYVLFTKVTYDVEGKFIIDRSATDSCQYSHDRFILANSDFSKAKVAMYSNGCPGRVEIRNTMFNQFYVGPGSYVRIDCSSTFAGGKLNKQTGSMMAGEFFAQNEGNLYEFHSTNMPDTTALVLTETCQEQTMNFSSDMSLNDFHDSYGYDIDDTWTFTPDDVVLLKDGKIVPMKTGTVKISKEIDGEIQTIILEVLADERPNTFINPQTSASFLILLSLLMMIMIGVIVVIRKKTITQ